MKIGVYGSGSIGKRHIANIRAIDPDAEAFTFARGEALKNCDAVIVATPSSLHMRILEEAIAQAIPCYIEKPVVTESADVSKLELLSVSMPTLVGCNLRYLGSLRRLRDMLKTGAIGRPVRAIIEAGQWLPDWRPAADYRQSYSAKIGLGGGVIFDLIHEIDLARWLFGEFDTVKAVSSRLSDLEIETEDTASIILAGAGVPIVSVNVDYVSRKPRRSIVIIGDKGNLIWSLPGKSLALESATETTVIDCGTDAFDVSRTYVEAMGEFLDAVKTGKPTSQDIGEGLKTVRLAIKAKQQ
jgi:predicted dehydrogenase